MENRKVYVGYDSKAKEKKPEKGEIVGSKRRAVDHWAEIDLEDLAELIGNQGHSMVPGHLVGGLKAENCTGMQLFALDFDQGITFKEIESRCEQIQIPIAFAYHTFSSTQQNEKFRVVFAHDVLIEDVYIIKIVIAMLYRIFPECDSSCKNLDRIYLGGKELICCNSEARISLVQVYSVFYERLNNNENLRRAVRNFCNKYHILLIDGSAAIRAWSEQ